MRKIYIIFAFFSVIGATWLLSRSLHIQEQLKPKPSTGITKKITIWIHGTRGAEILPVGILNKTKTVEENICTAPAGLHLASTIDQKFHNYAIAQCLGKYKDEFPIKHFYSFGWSGELNPQARKKAAQELYAGLKQLMLRYVVQYAAVPEVTIITHSHGGNVALNLATIIDAESPITIERLILLACPVQQETASYIDSNIFKSIFAIHSHADAIQILDPQGLHPLKEGIKESWSNGSLKPLACAAKESSKIPLFSERHFASQKVRHIAASWKEHAPWSDNDMAPFGPLKDLVKKWAQVDKSPRGLLHVEFLLHSFLTRLPEMLQIENKSINDEVEFLI